MLLLLLQATLMQLTFGHILSKNDLRLVWGLQERLVPHEVSVTVSCFCVSSLMPLQAIPEAWRMSQQIFFFAQATLNWVSVT